MNTIECFNGLPIEYEAFLIKKYDSFITTCRYVEIYGKDKDINYMLVYQDGVLIELLIFGNKGCTATCFNSLVGIDQNIVRECAKKLFEKYPAIQKVHIEASFKDYALNMSFLVFQSDDYILNLPSTTDDYYLELGSRTRKHIKQRIKRLQSEFHQVNFITTIGAEIEKSVIDKIIQFNRERMKIKGKISGIDITYQNNIYKYSQHYGCVTYLELDGVIVAGCIATILNKGIFLHVIAHDNNFYTYNVGEICAFYTIQASIERGLSAVHFLWGESELKKRFLAQPYLLFSYFIYRAYSLDYILCKFRALLVNNKDSFKHSKYSKPIKTAIKSYRKRISQE